MASKVANSNASVEDQSLTLEEVSHEFVMWDRLWDKLDCRTDLSRVFERELLLFQDVVLTRCVCIALGTFSRPLTVDRTLHRDSVRSIRQLVALGKVLDILRTSHVITDVYVQDPAFNDVEVAFLTHLGYHVIHDPAAKDKITDTTFFFAPCCRHTLAAAHFEKSFPALYIGNDLEDVLLGHRKCIEEGYDSPLEENKADGPVENTFRRFIDATFNKTMPEICQQVPFPKDGFTIRWLKGSRTDG